MNINGFCPHCNANLDGDLVINYPLSQGKTREEAVEYVQSYEGWNEHGLHNKWGRQIGQSNGDRITEWKCPDCNKSWAR